MVAKVDLGQPRQIGEGLMQREAASIQIDVMSARVDATRASIPVPPLSIHSELSPSENTRLRNRWKYSSWMRSLVESDGSAAAVRLATSLIAASTAELLHLRGSISHEAAATGKGDARALLQEAMGFYYDGLQLVSEQSAPYLWASLQMNLATAHLASPMVQASDQLRLGVATQALRACRRVFDVEQHPGPWSTATLNLANALVYTPSTHQGDNLVEAVELYELVLESGIREKDPLGLARLLSNQGNALAHLGIFGEARAKLVEAWFLFEEHLDHDSAMSVRSVLDEIAKAEVPDPEDAMSALAHQAEQMSRMPTGDGAFTSGMGVRVGGAGDLTGPPPKPTVTRLPAGSAPRSPDRG